MARPLNEQVVVLTGASSGIGRATAIELGRRGATVVLAARNEESLRDVAKEVLAAGGQALVVPTDVTDRAQVTGWPRPRSRGSAGSTPGSTTPASASTPPSTKHLRS